LPEEAVGAAGVVGAVEASVIVAVFPSIVEEAIEE
jgi:hypothetical protein